MIRNFLNSLSRFEMIALTIIGLCLLSIAATKFGGQKLKSQVVLANMQVRTLYQNQVVQYFGERQFVYSVTKPASAQDYFWASPPKGKVERLVGYPGDSIVATDDKKTPNKKPVVVSNVKKLEFASWDRIGFDLATPSAFVYRVEPEPQYHEMAKPSDEMNSYYHFHVVAIGDLNGDDKYQVIKRGAYVDKNNFFQGEPGTSLLDVATDE